MVALDLPNPLSDMVGGACEKLLYHIVKELSKTHEIHIIVDRKTLDLQLDELKGSVFFHGFDSDSRFSSKLLEYGRFISYLHKLDVKYNFDVFHSFSFPFAIIILLLSKFKRKPAVFSELTHITWMHNRKKFLSKANFWINIASTIWFATATIVPSTFIKERMIQSIKCPPKKVIVIPFGLPPASKLSNHHCFREKYGIPKCSPILTFVGRLVPYKGVHNIIEAMLILRKSFPEIRLVIAGPRSGDFTSCSHSNNFYYEQLLLQTKNLGLSEAVKFVGFLQIRELYELFADTSIFVFPTTEEAFGLVLIETMSMGLPIITSNLPPMNEIVDNNSGRLVAPNDYQQIANAVSELLSSHNLGEISQYNKKKFLNEYASTCMTKAYNELYTQIFQKSFRLRHYDSPKSS